MRLYDLELSGNCYKVRLFLSLIGQATSAFPSIFSAERTSGRRSSN
jgi:glutathione S-transferase